MEVKILFGVIAAALALLSAAVYIRDILHGNSKPHTYTWLIWTIVTAIAFWGQWVSGGGAGSWATGAATLVTGCIFLLSLRHDYGTHDITTFDTVCLVLALTAILPWALAKSVLWSVLLATAIDLIAFFPTMRKTWNAPRSESLASMYIDAIKHALSIYAMTSYSLITVIYPASVLVTKFVIIAEILYLRTRRKN